QLTRLVERRLQLRLPLEEPPAIIPHEITLEEKVAELEGHLAATGPGGRLGLWPLLGGARTRAEIVLTFMAVLELLRRQRITAGPTPSFRPAPSTSPSSTPAWAARAGRCCWRPRTGGSSARTMGCSARCCSGNRTSRRTS